MERSLHFRIPMTDAQAKSLPSPEYFFATPYFFLLSKKRADTRMLREEIDFLLSGPFNVETVRTYFVRLKKQKESRCRYGISILQMSLIVVIEKYPTRPCMRPSSLITSEKQNEKPFFFSITKLSHLIRFIAVLYIICLLIFMAEMIVSRLKRKINK